MNNLSTLAVAGSILAATIVSASAQGQPYSGSPAPSGTVIQQQSNTTGNTPDLVISRGATGADTITTDSAAGGNASRPEQAIPNGSAGGGTGGR